jgi:predicted transcriptional regulator
MARPQITRLTDNELFIMKALWAKGRLSVADILAVLKKRPAPAYTTVLSAVQVMEKKGYLRHIEDGKAYLYIPVLTKVNYEKQEVKAFAKRVANGSAIDLAINIVQNEHLSTEDIKKLRKVLKDL